VHAVGGTAKTPCSGHRQEDLQLAHRRLHKL
jgi:hypothetical protein